MNRDFHNLIIFLLFILKNIPKTCCESNKNKVVIVNNNFENLQNSENKKKYIKYKEKKNVKNKNDFIKKERNKIMNDIIDITEYKVDNNKLKKVIDEVNKVNEEDRVFIQSDTEGKVFNIISTLQVANIIDINKPIIIYYNFENGNFEKNKSENSIELKLFEVNKDFKGIYIHLGDIVDRCTGNHQCLKSLLYLLYVKQELGEKVKLICGNHELTDYGNPINIGSDCCKNIKHIITLIVFKAISKGQIKYLDKIKIGITDYILTHKVLYKSDINQIKEFLEDIMGEEKDLKDYNIYDLIDVVNDNFKEYFTDFFKININNIAQIYEYSNIYDHLSSVIVSGNRVGDNYIICLENQICGHDHHEIDKCYIKDKNILFVDNFSFDFEIFMAKNYQIVFLNIHFFNKNKELTDHKLFNIINDKNNLDINIY